MKEYNFPKYITSDEFKEFRKRLGFTQKEFAGLLGVSKPTVERWESGKSDITGPVVMLIDILREDITLLEKQEFPSQIYPLRLKYMYGNKCCTVIDVDEINQRVKIKNFVRNIIFRAFGNNTEPDFEDYREFLESRCFPRSRDKMKIHLEALNIPFYDPILIIGKTKGRMADDDFWIEIERGHN